MTVMLTHKTKLENDKQSACILAGKIENWWVIRKTEQIAPHPFIHCHGENSSPKAETKNEMVLDIENALLIINNFALFSIFKYVSSCFVWFSFYSVVVNSFSICFPSVSHMMLFISIYGRLIRLLFDVTRIRR